MDEIMMLIKKLLSQNSSGASDLQTARLRSGQGNTDQTTDSWLNDTANAQARQKAQFGKGPSQAWQQNQQANSFARQQANMNKQPSLEWLNNELMKQNAKRMAGDGGW